MKVIGYLRVSTERQAEEGLGLGVQCDAVRRWANDHGHRVVGWYSDEGTSGSNGLETREALPEALSALQDGEASGLVVYRLDRLARDLVLQEQLLAELWRAGVDVFSTSPAETGYLEDDPEDPSRRLIRQVLGAVAEYERAMIALRLRAGRRRKAEQGGYAYGAPPFGYRAEDGELVPDPEEQDALALMRRLRDEGESLRGIARALAQRGYEPRQTRRGIEGGNGREPTGGWHPTTLARILERGTPSPTR